MAEINVGQDRNKYIWGPLRKEAPGTAALTILRFDKCPNLGCKAGKHVNRTY